VMQTLRRCEAAALRPRAGAWLLLTVLGIA